MRKIFYRFRHWLHNKLYKPKHKLTARGIYLCNYLVEKYINETRPDDYNQDYEEMVDKTLAHIKSTPFFNRFKDKNGEVTEIPESDKREFAALMVIVRMLYLCREEDRNKIYQYIADEHALKLIKGCIKEGMVF